jgi:hypothetical protein
MNIRKYAKLAAVPAGILVSGLIVAQTSSAAFTVQTQTDASSWSTGTVELTNDHVGQAVFDIDSVVPGASGSQKVVVTYDGDVQAGITMFTAGDAQTDNPLAQALHLTITEQGVAGAIYDGSLADFSEKSSSADGVGTWTAAGTGDETKDYTIAWSLPSTVTEDAIQGIDTSLVFAWEAASIAS